MKLGGRCALLISVLFLSGCFGVLRGPEAQPVPDECTGVGCTVTAVALWGVRVSALACIASAFAVKWFGFQPIVQATCALGASVALYWLGSYLGFIFWGLIALVVAVAYWKRRQIVDKADDVADWVLGETDEQSEIPTARLEL